MYRILQTQELQKYLLEFDVDNDGMLDFEEFKLAIKFAQSKMKKKGKNEEGEFWGPEKCDSILYEIAKNKFTPEMRLLRPGEWRMTNTEKVSKVCVIN